MAYRSALEVFSKEQSPQAWAQTNYNLGLALQRLGIPPTAGEFTIDLNLRRFLDQFGNE